MNLNVNVQELDNIQVKNSIEKLNKLVNYSINAFPECSDLIEHYKQLNTKIISYNILYKEICWVVYSSGFKNDIIKKYWPKITKAYFNFEIDKVINKYTNTIDSAKKICEKSEFNNINKAKWCIYNAYRIIYLEEEYGKECLTNYIMRINNSNTKIEDVYKIKNLLNFKGIGDVTIFHLLKNIGINIYKPDVHVSRIMNYIGIKKEKYTEKELFFLLEFYSNEINVDISTIDTALFVLGKNCSLNYEKQIDLITK